MSNLISDIYWTENAKDDLKQIYAQLKVKYSKEVALKIRGELFNCIDVFSFSEQFQIDEYRLDCRRIIVRNFKVLYQVRENTIFIIRVFNSFRDPLKSLK